MTRYYVTKLDFLGLSGTVRAKLVGTCLVGRLFTDIDNEI